MDDKSFSLSWLFCTLYVQDWSANRQGYKDWWDRCSPGDADHYSYLRHTPRSQDLARTRKIQPLQIHPWGKGKTWTLWLDTIWWRTEKLHCNEIGATESQGCSCSSCAKVQVCEKYKNWGEWYVVSLNYQKRQLYFLAHYVLVLSSGVKYRLDPPPCTIAPLPYIGMHPVNFS